MTSLKAAVELIEQIQSLKEHCDDQAYEIFRAAAMAQISPLAAAIDIARKPLEVSVAVLGVFRGGKSTLLNALLGARLLPAALAPTTATVTEIAYRPGEFLMEARYVAEGDASYQAACEALKRLLHETPAERVLEVFCAPHNRASVEALLGMYGVMGQHGRIEAAVLLQLYDTYRHQGALPELPRHDLLGTTEVLRETSLDRFEQAVRPFVMFAGAEGAYDRDAAVRQFMLSKVDLQGPFEALAPNELTGAVLRLIDTPGLVDPRPFVRGIVEDFLTRADCVCLNLSNHGNFADSDVKLIRRLLDHTLHRKLIVTLGRADTLGARPEELLRHIETQRGMLETQILALREGHAEEAKAFAAAVPIIPVVPLASLIREERLRGAQLTMQELRLVEDYPSDEEAGLGALKREIAKITDPAARQAQVNARLRDQWMAAAKVCLDRLEGAVVAARKTFDIGPESTRLLVTRIQTARSALGHENGIETFGKTLASIASDYLEQRGKKPIGTTNRPLCDFKCCGEPATKHFSYRHIKHGACTHHEIEVKRLHDEHVLKEKADRPECLVDGCQEAEVAGKAHCRTHACCWPHCRSPAVSGAFCSYHEMLLTEEYGDHEINHEAEPDHMAERCGARTQAGGLCQNWPTPGLLRCWQHYGMPHG